jgi:hypothetical protein
MPTYEYSDEKSLQCGDLATPLVDGQTSWVYCITLPSTAGIFITKKVESLLNECFS